MADTRPGTLKEAEIERLMADLLVERLAAENLRNTSGRKDEHRRQSPRIARTRRFRAIVRKAVRDVFDGIASSGLAPSGKPDPAAVRLLEPLSVLVARKREQLSERNVELLVEAMLPANDPMSAVRSRIEADNAKARVRFAEEVPCHTSAELAELAGHNARNRSATGSRWKADNKVFSVQLGGRELFPAFQFREGKPEPVIARVLASLPPGMSPWQIAFWFVSSNPWLDGAVPSQNLDKAEQIIAAAHQLREEPAG